MRESDLYLQTSLESLIQPCHRQKAIESILEKISWSHEHVRASQQQVDAYEDAKKQYQTARDTMKDLYEVLFERKF